MKVIVIPDLHGKDVWKETIELECDRWIFLGDYVDHWTLSNQLILENLKEIVEFKKMNMDKVILLKGNHDIQYQYHPFFSCSGFRPTMCNDLKILFNENSELFDIAHQIGSTLFTHAGVSRNWYKGNQKILDKYTEGNLADTFNSLEKTHLREILHQVGARRGGGRYDHGGITWADKMDTYENLIPGITQVVGHSNVHSIKNYEFNNGSKIYYTDCLDKKIEFLTLDL